MINVGNLDSRVGRVRTEIVRVCDVDVQDAASTIPRAMIHTIRLGDVSSAEVASLANVWCTLISLNAVMLFTSIVGTPGIMLK